MVLPCAPAFHSFFPLSAFSPPPPPAPRHGPSAGLLLLFPTSPFSRPARSPGPYFLTTGAPHLSRTSTPIRSPVITEFFTIFPIQSSTPPFSNFTDYPVLRSDLCFPSYPGPPLVLLRTAPFPIFRPVPPVFEYSFKQVCLQCRKMWLMVHRFPAPPAPFLAFHF